MRRTFLLVSLFCTLTSAMAASYSLLQDQGVEARLETTKDAVQYDAPLEGTIRITLPITQQISMPDLAPRFRGFASVELFELGREEGDTQAQQTWRFRCMPSGVGPWRLMPFALTSRDTSTGKTQEFATKVIDFAAPPALPEASGAPECDLDPQWVAPGWKIITLWLVGAVAVVGLALLLWPLFRRVRRTLHERTLAPEVRARLELDRLLQTGLLAQGAYKKFYSELTGIVRRYYERSYAIRASRQTTQEFLSSLAADTRFDEVQRAALQNFLEAADRVKFAGIESSAQEATAATNVATETIDQDAKKRQQAAAAERP